MSKKNPEKIPAETNYRQKKWRENKKLENRKNYILLSVSCTIQIKCTYIIMPYLLEHRFLLKNLMQSSSFLIVLVGLCTNVLSFYPPKSCFRIFIKFLESKFSFSADISPFYVVIYNSKTWIGILNTDLDSKLKLEF